MSHKSAKIAALIERCQGRELPAHYLGYFECFNQSLYYESHDVLEEFWLTVRRGPDDGFYKGLIQFAGAFVHLQKNRLNPAAALFRLCRSYLAPYAPTHQCLDVERVISIIDDYLRRLEQGKFTDNPFSHDTGPKLELGPQE